MAAIKCHPYSRTEISLIGSSVRRYHRVVLPAARASPALCGVPREAIPGHHRARRSLGVAIHESSGAKPIAYAIGTHGEVPKLPPEGEIWANLEAAIGRYSLLKQVTLGNFICDLTMHLEGNELVYRLIRLPII